MTILKTAYDVCKAVIASPGRTPLKSLIYDLNYALGSPPPGHVNRSEFGYFARRQRAQFLGYLLVDQERVRLASTPTPILIPPLSGAEQQLLLSAHSQLVTLDRQAVEPLLSVFPDAAQPTDPYGHLTPLTVPLDHTKSFFPEAAFDAMAKAFQSHPALKLAAAIPSGLVRSVAPSVLLESVLKLEKDLRREGPGKTPRQLTDFVHSEPMMSPQRMLLRLIASLMSLRASVGVMNQMIYQAVQMDKPPVLDQSNIADLRHLGSSLTGEGVRIVFQPDRATGNLEVGDVFLLKAIPNTFKLEGLVISERMSSRFNETGATKETTGRFVSSTLDPYTPFVGSL